MIRNLWSKLDILLFIIFLGTLLGTMLIVHDIDVRSVATGDSDSASLSQMSVYLPVIVRQSDVVFVMP